VRVTHAVQGVLDELLVRGGVRKTKLVPIRIGCREDTRLRRKKADRQS